MTSIEMLQATVADLLSADEWLSIHGVVAYAENKLDIEVSVTAAITQVGIVATVVTPEIEFIGTDGEGNLVAEISALVISISEMTAINRERPGACLANVPDPRCAMGGPFSAPAPLPGRRSCPARPAR